MNIVQSNIEESQSTKIRITFTKKFNAKRTILKKINGLLIIHFCFGKYSFSLNTFRIYL